MYINFQDDTIYIYRSMDIFLDALRNPRMKMFNADYALWTSKNYPDRVHFLKDRSGIFNENNALPLETVLKLIEVLMEEQK